MIEFDYTISTRPSKAPPPPPPRVVAHLADTLRTGTALRLACAGKDDIEMLKLQARLNGIPRKYQQPWSVATIRAVEDDTPVLYAWAIPLRPPRKRNGVE